MPIIKSAIKRMKQTVKRRDRNVAIKKEIKLATKAFMAEPTAEKLSKVQSEYDKAVKKGLLNKSTVSRRKARMSRIAKEAGVTLSATAKKAAPKAAPKATAAKAEKPATKKAPAKKAAPKKTA